MTEPTLKSIILPQEFKGKDFPIIIKILFESVIRMSSSKLNLNILFVFLGIRRVYFGIFGLGEFIEEIVWFRLRLIEWCFHVGVELFGKWITVINVKDSFKNANVNSNIEIFPSVIYGKFVYSFGYFLSFQEDTLRDARVFYLGFSNVNSLVGQVVVYQYFSYTVVL